MAAAWMWGVRLSFSPLPVSLSHDDETHSPTQTRVFPPLRVIVFFFQGGGRDVDPAKAGGRGGFPWECGGGGGNGFPTTLLWEGR